MKSPLKVRTYRGTIVDGDSLVAGAVFRMAGPSTSGAEVAPAERGILVEHFGPLNFRMSPRSTFKSFQAIPYILSGAYAQEGRHTERLALACSSHLGEDLHVAILEPWMRERGLTEADLACGPQTGRGNSRLRNNCSGKHLGLLSACQDLGIPTRDYNNPDSLIQTMLRKVFGDFFGEDFSRAGQGTDGCSLPVYDCEIQNLARAWGQLLGPSNMEYAAACDQILQAMSRHPLLIEGTGTLTSALIEASGGNLIVKGGAAGVYTGVALRERLAFAFKCVDGQMDPVRAVLLDFLGRHSILDAATLSAVDAKTFGPPHNWAGETTGHREILPD